MALEISVGPQQLSISQNYTVLVTGPDGQIGSAPEQGLLFFDTRLVSSWHIYADGAGWDLLNSACLSYHTCRAYLTNPEIATAGGDIAARSMSLVIGRTVRGGLHEDIDLTNYGTQTVRFNLEVSIRSDFADIFEIKSGDIVRRGLIDTQWTDDPATLHTTYRNGDFVRSVIIRICNNDTQARFANGRISFGIDLTPGQRWHACLNYDLVDGVKTHAAPEKCVAHGGGAVSARALDDWFDGVLEIRCSNEEFYRYHRQALVDLAALRMPIEDMDGPSFFPAAGKPWFMALFGRDSLIAGLQNALIYPEFAIGALEILGRLQAVAIDDYRDAEPGKILHELRRGELAYFKLIPHTPYYGSADATLLYPIVLHVTWRCTGDRALLERYMPIAERCLDWIDAYGDRDGDGFQEYETRSPAGLENQGWKDAGDAVLNSDGTPVKGPKALCELQGYVYTAWLRMAELMDVLIRPGEAAVLREKAERLRTRFNEAFWDEETGYYVFALDGDKKKVMSVASNPGLLLWCGIVPEERAGRLVERLTRSDMWSGWGIRTLSSDHRAYNPLSYQNGAVWPHDNGFIALGFKMYGFSNEAARIARDVSRAAGYFMLHQLPELYAGIERDPTSFPIQYLGANVPQAWAAGSAFMFLQAIIGFQPDASAGMLYLDPTLPDWLPDLAVSGLRMGQQTFDLRFWRDGKETRFQVDAGDAGNVELRSYKDAERLLRGFETLEPA